MDINECYPSKYLSAPDLDGAEVSFVIREVVVENLAAPGQPVDEKPVVYFTDEPKGLGLNKTNAAAISKQFGTETDGWTGKTITLFPTQTDFKGQIVPCIRVKLATGITSPPSAAPAPSAPPTAAPPPPTAAPPPSAAPSAPATKASAWAAFKAWHDRQNVDKPGTSTNEQLVASWKNAIADTGKLESEFVATDWAWMATSGVATLAIPF